MIWLPPIFETIAWISEETLSRPPTDPEHAKDYVKLYELWKEARDMLDFATAGEKKFDEWDSRVQSFLDPAEREFYLSPYDGLDMRYLDYRTVSRMNHLTKSCSIAEASTSKTSVS